MGLNILVTGAGGFLGKAVVAEAEARGHDVTPMVRVIRADTPDHWTPVRADLSTMETWPEALLQRADVVIHLASSMSGRAKDHATHSYAPLRRLLHALKAMESPPRLLHMSSIAVLSTARALSDHLIDEDTPSEPSPRGRDVYARAKLRQEEMIRASEVENYCCLRAGAIYGPNRLWNAHLGAHLGPIFLRIGERGEVPVISLESAAMAIVLAAEASELPTALNLVDDALPDRAGMLAALGVTGGIGLNWRFLHGLASAASLLPFPKPGLLQPGTVRARYMPVSYGNARAKAVLGWTPEADFRGAVSEAKAKEVGQ